MLINNLGARVHLFVHPHRRDAFIALFRDVLECHVLERDFGLSHPILLVQFPDKSAFSVELTEAALEEKPTGRAINDEQAFRGAWIEFRSADVARCQQKLRDAGIPEFRHRGSNHAYFSAPGGQVFRIIDVAYTGL